jgi:hypothetical protein
VDTVSLYSMHASIHALEQHCPVCHCTTLALKQHPALTLTDTDCGAQQHAPMLQQHARRDCTSGSRMPQRRAGAPIAAGVLDGRQAAADAPPPPDHARRLAAESTTQAMELAGLCSPVANRDRASDKTK